MFEASKTKLQNTVLENKVRSKIWSSEPVKGLSLQAGIYEQEPVTRDILSPMFCKSGIKPPTSIELFPTLNIEHVIEATPYWNVVKAGILRKTGEGFYAKSHKRYFVLTNEKLIYYYDEIEKKGTIQLNKMRNCGIVKGSNKKFYIECSDRKWELEVVNEKNSGGTAKEWVASIQYVTEGNIGHGDDMTMEESETPKSNGIRIEEKESETEKIVKLLTKMLKLYTELLKHTETENETTETVENAVKWYEDLENTRCAIDILLAKWPRGTICPPGVVRARAQLKELMEQSQQVILEDIKALANENISNFTVLRLNKACCLMGDLNKGQKMVSEFITDTLLKNAASVFAAGNKDSKLQHIDRRFNEYRRQMKDYDKRYNSFIPKWWDLPIKIASRFCNLMGETLDDQLTRFPENKDSISVAKQKCVKFEQELIEDAMRRICCLEIDVRSWTKWDKGDPISYIKIDNSNVMIPGAGLCVVAIDLFTKKVLKKKLFPLHKYSAWKKSAKHKKIIQQWLLFVNDIDEQTLIVMATHEWSGHCEFKKALGIKSRLPKELQALNLTAADMVDETNLFWNQGPFIFIGRKGRKDSYFTLLSKKRLKGPVMARHIISPYIPKNRLKILCDVDQIPFYEGIISQVLERHLDIFVGEEAQNVQKILSNIFNEETIVKLEEKKNWLSAINGASIKQKSTAHFESIKNIGDTMKSSIQACMKISNGKPLLQLLKKYSQMLSEYASILLKLMNESGGNKLTNKLNLNDDEKRKLLALVENKNDDAKKSQNESGNVIKKKGFNIFNNITNISNSSTWSDVEIQYFVIYCCMIYNTCNKARDLLNDLIKIGKNDLQNKYRNGCKSSLIETRELFLSIEEQCLQLIRASVIDKFESIFEFEKHYDWELDNYKTKLTDSFDLYLTNVSKLLNPSALEHFYKMFCANLALKLFESILNSNTLNSSNDDKSQGSILIDFPPIIQTVIFKKIPPKTIKKMQIYINRCLNPVIKLIQLAYANAGDKYSKLEAIKNEKDNTKNIFTKFFGGGYKNKNKDKIDDENKDNEIDTNKQMETRQKTAIQNTVFAQKAVQFYTDKDIKLQILNNIPVYKEIFAEDDDENIQSINETLNDLNNINISDMKHDEKKEEHTEINNDSDSPLPELDDTAPTIAIDDDDDYFGNKPQTPKKKSVSGFVVKKSKKKKKRMAPSMTAPRIPMRPNNAMIQKTNTDININTNNQAEKPAISISISEPAPPKWDHNKTHNEKPNAISSLGIVGLSAMSLIVKKEIKLNRKWDVIRKVMVLRGFDVSDQQTIRILCEDAQQNIESQK